MSSGIDILSLDTSLSLPLALSATHQPAMEHWLQSGGRFCLGVIPTGPEAQKQLPPVAQLVETLHHHFNSSWLAGSGQVQSVLNQALFSPACGLAFHPISEAETVLEALVRFYEHSFRAEFTPLSPLGSETLRNLHEATVEASLIIPAKNAHRTLPKTVRDAHDFLKARYRESFEIILVPNPSPDDEQDQSVPVANQLAQEYPEVKVCPHLAPRGKGAALRTGFLGSKGKWIFFTDSDLPYDLRFFDQAQEKLAQGYHLVHGNRRLDTSEFSIPVKLLKIAYSRHRLGLWFNACVRAWLKISTTDTQAGIKALSRTLAMEFFSRQTCPGFLFDLEIFLTASNFNLPITELPVTLYLNAEKSTIRLLRECLLVGHWLTRIKWNQLRGHYGRKLGKTQLG